MGRGSLQGPRSHFVVGTNQILTATGPRGVSEKGRYDLSPKTSAREEIGAQNGRIRVPAPLGVKHSGFKFPDSRTLLYLPGPYFPHL